MKLIPNLAPIDEKAIKERGIPSLDLMERAGGHVADLAADIIQQLLDKHPTTHPLVSIVCGPGNNGGDGYVCARHLAERKNLQVVVISTAKPDQLSGDSRVNFNRLQHQNVMLVSAESPEVWDLLNRSCLIVDALFGSGLSRPIEGRSREIIQQINRSPARVIAVDLPSGIDGASGGIMGIAVRADCTVTFASAKPGLYLCPGKAYAGTVEVVDIGIPGDLIEADASRIFLLEPDEIARNLPKRKICSHKYTYGSVLVVAGSRDMPGAAAMCAESALRAGAGIVKLASPESTITRMQLPPEIIQIPLPETEDGILHPDSMHKLLSAWGQVSTVALGPGITQEPSALAFFEQFLTHLQQSFTGTVVIDADGLNCLSRLSEPPRLGSRFILTPHLGECARLTGLDKDHILNHLPDACRETVSRYGATVVLKSASTVIGETTQTLWINPTGNPGMATAGSGDVLTGLIAGFSAQGLSPEKASCVGVYLHGLAGDKAAEALTPYCLTATDIIGYLPQAIRTIANTLPPVRSEL